MAPIPTRLQGEYDVVHVGLLVMAVRRNNPGPLLENLMMLLSMDSPPFSFGAFVAWTAASTR